MSNFREMVRNAIRQVYFFAKQPVPFINLVDYICQQKMQCYKSAAKLLKMFRNDNLQVAIGELIF